MLVLPTGQEATSILDRYEDEDSDDGLLFGCTNEEGAHSSILFRLSPLCPAVHVPYLEDALIRRFRGMEWNESIVRRLKLWDRRSATASATEKLISRSNRNTIVLSCLSSHATPPHYTPLIATTATAASAFSVDPSILEGYILPHFDKETIVSITMVDHRRPLICSDEAQRKRIYVQFENCDSVQKALLLDGCKLYIPSSLGCDNTNVAHKKNVPSGTPGSRSHIVFRISVCPPFSDLNNVGTFLCKVVYRNASESGVRGSNKDSPAQPESVVNLVKNSKLNPNASVFKSPAVVPACPPVRTATNYQPPPPYGYGVPPLSPFHNTAAYQPLSNFSLGHEPLAHNSSLTNLPLTIPSMNNSGVVTPAHTYAAPPAFLNNNSLTDALMTGAGPPSYSMTTGRVEQSHLTPEYNGRKNKES